jgi:hypothetical protein
MRFAGLCGAVRAESSDSSGWIRTSDLTIMSRARGCEPRSSAAARVHESPGSRRYRQRDNPARLTGVVLRRRRAVDAGRLVGAIGIAAMTCDISAQGSGGAPRCGPGGRGFESRRSPSGLRTGASRRHGQGRGEHCRRPSSLGCLILAPGVSDRGRARVGGRHQSSINRCCGTPRRPALAPGRRTTSVPAAPPVRFPVERGSPPWRIGLGKPRCYIAVRPLASVRCGAPDSSRTRSQGRGPAEIEGVWGSMDPTASQPRPDPSPGRRARRREPLGAWGEPAAGGERGAAARLALGRRSRAA